MSKRAVSLAAAAMLCVGLSVALTGTAGAAPIGGPGLLQPTGPGYPPGTTTTIINPTFVTQTQTTVINGHFTVEECGFLPNTTADYEYSGGSSGVFAVDSNGCITITINAFDPHVTINGGPLEPAQWQGNTIVVVGTGANTAPRTYTLTFNIVQPSTPPASGSGTTSGSSSSATNTAANTGSGTASGSSGSGSGSGSSGSGSSSDPGTLAFTGSNTAATLLAGLLLLVAGGLLVLFTRRRSERQTN